jgi:hypothetical protein
VCIGTRLTLIGLKKVVSFKMSIKIISDAIALI